MREFHNRTRRRDRDRRFGGGRRRRDMRFERPLYREKPVKEGEEYDVEISAVSNRGEGIARVKNFVVFVPGTKEGDKVKIRVKKVRMKFAEAEVVGEAEAAAEGPTEQEIQEAVAEEPKPEVFIEEETEKVIAEPEAPEGNGEAG